MRITRLVFASLLALAAACSSGSKNNDGGLKFDSGMTGGGNPDLTMSMMQGGNPDLTMHTTGGGTLSCLNVYDCYFKMQCADTACLMTCDNMGKTPQYGSDAESLINCAGAALGMQGANGMLSGGPCSTMCNDQSDAGIATCQACIFGSCNMQGQCTGGQCSTQLTACIADK